MFPDENKGREWSEDTRDTAEILEEFRSITKKAGTGYITFNRMHRSMLQQLMKTYKDPKLDIQKSPDIHFEGEMAADAGGPTKEYFYSAIESLFNVDPIFGVSLFTGERGHYVPLMNMDAISSGCFKMVGKLLAHSVLHGGPGLPGLAPAVRKYLVSGSVIDAADLVSVEDIPDIDLRDLIENKVCNLCYYHGYLFIYFVQSDSSCLKLKYSSSKKRRLS